MGYIAKVILYSNALNYTIQKNPKLVRLIQ
jgi:hypothetical protein